MKKLILVIAMLLLSFNVGATTWFESGVLFGNVCRLGAWYTVYPVTYGQPVGSRCPLRLIDTGEIWSWGYVTSE